MKEELINISDNITYLTAVFASLWIFVILFRACMHLLNIVYYTKDKKDDSFESILRATLDSFFSNHPVL